MNTYKVNLTLLYNTDGIKISFRVQTAGTDVIFDGGHFSSPLCLRTYTECISQKYGGFIVQRRY